MKPLLKLSNNTDVYYTCLKCFSYNYFMNVICGGRGIGKTTSFLIYGVNRVFDKNEEFIYLRRYKPEIKEFASKDSLAPILDGVAYKGDGNGGYTMIYENTKLGYAIPLSVTSSYKSVNFSKVGLIIYDEAILPRGGSYHYLKNEVEMLLEFVSTVFRTRTNTRVVILGNNADLFNPFFSYFNIPSFDGIYTDKSRGLYCELAKNSPKLLELEEKTPLYKLIKDTSYGEYHYDNKVLGSVDAKIIPKPSGTRLFIRLVMNYDTLNLYTYWLNGEEHLYCERREKVIDDKVTYPIMEDGNPNYYYIDLVRRKFKGYLHRLYFNKLMEFNDEKASDIFYWIIDNI